MRWQTYAYFLGVVTIFAGVAVMAFSSSRLIDIFGGAAVVGGLGASASAAAGITGLRRYIGALLIATLMGGSFFSGDADVQIDANVGDRVCGNKFHSWLYVFSLRLRHNQLVTST